MDTEKLISYIVSMAHIRASGVLLKEPELSHELYSRLMPRLERELSRLARELSNTIREVAQ